MQLILLESVFNLGFFALTMYMALLLMEKIGKKRVRTVRDRATLAIAMAAGATMFQLIVHAATLVYSVGLVART